MKRNLLAGVLGAAALVAAVATGCAHGNNSKGAVRVVNSEQDIAGCEKLSQVRLSGTWTSGAGKEELQKLVASKGGNVLLLSEGKGTPSGVAYRCSGGTAAGAP